MMITAYHNRCYEATSWFIKAQSELTDVDHLRQISPLRSTAVISQEGLMDAPLDRTVALGYVDDYPFTIARSLLLANAAAKKGRWFEGRSHKPCNWHN